jgi:hypothetical protein
MLGACPAVRRLHVGSLDVGDAPASSPVIRIEVVLVWILANTSVIMV